MPKLKRPSIFIRNRFLVRKTWRYFSKLGSDYSDKMMIMRSNVLSNQLNFVLFGTMFLLLVISVSIQLITHDPMSIGTLRVAIMLLVSSLNLLFAYFRFNRISKYSLIFLPPVVFMLGPILIGYVEEEGYTYNPYVLIATSIIPQLILSSEKEKVIYWSSMIYYFLLVLFIDVLMIHFQSRDFPIVERIKLFYPYYKLGHIGAFIFINLCIYHLRKINFRFEDRLNEKNLILDHQNRELKVQREKIIQQKDLIEQKSRSIFESIQYASRIQNAVLQPINFMNEWGIDNFILYKPAAVVSGDFYWGYKKDNNIIIAAADCTGHGVPGAFMSMLGLAFLDDILNTRKVKNAAEVLDVLREDVINKLRQKGDVGEARDGMDISLCMIDKSAGTLDFSGANNPLYLIRAGSLSKIEADKMPIGIFSSPVTPFTNHVLEIKNGDHLYLFSDGYADQFGGERGKRFMVKPLQDLLLHIHTFPMDQQREILDCTFEKWKGTYDQVDDVLVMGLHLI
jgi:serine phosphatase RsbU (regulator of sigma subunit)